MKMSGRLWLVILALLLVGGVTGYMIKLWRGEDSPPLHNVDEELILSAWLAEWEWTDDTFAQHLSLMPSSLQLFAIYFDEQADLVISDKLDKLLAEAQQQKEKLRPIAKEDGTYRLYMSIVNDIIVAGASNQFKQGDIITKLMETEKSQAKHLAALLQVVERYELDGIELDYEKVAAEDWPAYLSFITTLQEQLALRDKQLRVVVEPSALKQRLEWPVGPQYVVMAYNLFGPHTIKAGPKADKAFITSLANQMKDKFSTEAQVLAISVGGFDWSDDGVTAVTELEARAIRQQYQVEVERDPASDAIHFSYTSDDGKHHQLWYADEQTISSWIQTAREAGIYQFSIWKLGGLSQFLLDYLRQL